MAGKYVPQYLILQHQCYWFANIVEQLTRTLFQGSLVEGSHFGWKGLLIANSSLNATIGPYGRPTTDELNHILTDYDAIWKTRQVPRLTKMQAMQRAEQAVREKDEAVKEKDEAVREKDEAVKDTQMAEERMEKIEERLAKLEQAAERTKKDKEEAVRDKEKLVEELQKEMRRIQEAITKLQIPEAQVDGSTSASGPSPQ